jgi:hypothetical protein
MFLAVGPVTAYFFIGEFNMKKRTTLFQELAEENKKISNALKAIGYETIKIDISQIRNAEHGSIDVQIWAKIEGKS